MIELELDGQKVQVQEGSMVMHAAEKAGTFIPHFCYHKKLSIAANCRMCLVDIEKMPKPMPACATPVTQGMVVKTKSEKAIKAQHSVMEFLLINHPLDCPICDQAGECQLQDIAVGYGNGVSRYEEEKRTVVPKDVGSLISMQEMNRCIQCTRCVRFGQEIAGDMEFGMSHRGEHSEIETFVRATINSELSGNMIDICPVGALTSKPFRYSARTWELGRRKSISPHDSTGANLIMQVKNNEVLRVVPFENEEVNECWIADRDRFSYEAVHSQERLKSPMIKQGGQWREVDWQTALEYVAHGIKSIAQEHGANSVGFLTSPHSTVEELYLARQLADAIGSGSVDSRLRQADFAMTTRMTGIRWLGVPIAALSNISYALVIGSNLRKDHPLFAQRIRQAIRKGAKVHAIVDKNLIPGYFEVKNQSKSLWAMPLQSIQDIEFGSWVQVLANMAHQVAKEKNVEAPAAFSSLGQVLDDVVAAQAKNLLSAVGDAQTKVILLGNAAAHHEKSSSLLALANWLAQQTGASVGFLTEAANTVGAQAVQALPNESGLNTQQMLQGQAKALILLGVEPVLDTAYGASGLAKTQMVVSLNPFKTNMDVCDVMLPIATFAETPGTFINAQGLIQSFYAVIKPLHEARPAWKVLRVLGNLLDAADFEYETAQQVLEKALGTEVIKTGQIDAQTLNNTMQITTIGTSKVVKPPVCASIYQLDALVRRSGSLQQTQDAKEGLVMLGGANV